MAGKPIDQQGDGSTVCDYTFIGDIVNGVLRASRWDHSDFEIFNLGDRRPTPSPSASAGSRMRLGIRWRSGFLPNQPSYVPRTYEDVSKAV